MIETIELPGTGRKTTRLGFGCSALMGGIGEKESLLLLETVFDAGIRHFDVAPSYGHGMAERCLGKFLRGKADRVTIATKYGIRAARSAGLLEIARTAVRPLARHFPAIRKRAAVAAAGLKSKASFSAKEGRQSLEHSLRELGVERTDLWLLHEPTAEDLDGSDLLPALQELQQQGRIGMYGVGAEHSKLVTVWDLQREYCPIVQYEWSVQDSLETAFPGAFRVQHRAIAGALAPLRAAMDRDPELCRRWSDAVDADLSQAEVCAALLMNLSLLDNPGGIVLFSSRSAAHVQANARAAGSPQWKLRASRFQRLLRNG
ncbi:MAG: aldo/keto reductase [Acidobacteriaceae bacterium]